jgi:hypothetical protein
MAATQLAAGLSGGAADREAAYSALFVLEAEHHELAATPKSRRCRQIADIAVACTIPMCGVLTLPVAEVGVEEFRRASQLLVALSGVDPGRVGAETIRLDVPAEERAWKEDATAFVAVMESKESALGVIRAKDRAKLTADDALTVAIIYGVWPTQLATCTGSDALTDACGLTFDEWLGTSYRGCFLNFPSTVDLDFNLALAPFLMDLMKTEPGELPEFTQGERARRLSIDFCLNFLYALI